MDYLWEHIGFGKAKSASTRDNSRAKPLHCASTKGMTILDTAIEKIVFSVHYIMTLMPLLLQGAKMSLMVFGLTVLLSIPLGLAIAMLGISRFWPLKAIANFYILVLRGTPLLLQLFFVYFGLPALGLEFDRFTSAVVAFVFNYGAYFAEIFRGGIQSIDSGQYEAAKALGIPYSKTMLRIIIPQTIRRIMPAIANETITLVKDTALITAIGVQELLKVAKDAVNRDTYTTPFLAAALIYLCVTIILTLIFRKVEQKYAFYERQET